MSSCSGHGEKMKTDDDARSTVNRCVPDRTISRNVVGVPFRHRFNPH